MRKFIVLLSFSLIVLSCNMYDDYLETDRNVADEETIMLCHNVLPESLLNKLLKTRI